MKLKLSHPAFIVIVSVVLSQIASWTISIVSDGIDEVRSSFDTDEGTLANFEPFYKTVNFFFKPYTKEELGESEPEPFFTANDEITRKLDMKLEALNERRLTDIETKLDATERAIELQKAQMDFLYSVHQASLPPKK